MNKQLFERYAALKNQIKELETEIETIQPEVMLAMGENQEVEVTDVGTFVIGKRRAWTYPEAIEQAKKNLDTAKKEAERTGDASYVEKPYLIFKATGDNS